MLCKLVLVGGLAIISVAFAGCNEPKNNFLGTWVYVSGDPLAAGSKLVISPEAIDESNQSNSVTVKYQVVNDHEALMDAAMGASIKLEIDGSGLLHESDPSSVFRRLD